ncbi:MAG: flagellar basal body rod protein FlgC [Epulopiscium sp. Nele67-Bin004]|nr:MAG: flagellar basal body rod protein FlgC [Epulopiscium sp. Nele67-Bin004]
MSFFNAMNIATTGMTAQRFRLDIITENIVNVNTTRTADGGGAYQRKTVLMEAIDGSGTFQESLEKQLGLNKNVSDVKGVQVTQIVKDNSNMPVVYDPTHPDADIDGYVTMPNVDIVTEMVDMISASRSYEASVTAFNNLKAMNAKALELGQ